MRLFKLIFLLMLVASITPTVMVGWTSVRRTREALVRDAQELAQERVKQLRLKTEALLREPVHAVEALARVPGFFKLPLEEQRAHVAAVLRSRREVSILTVFSADQRRIGGLQAFAMDEVAPTAVAAHEARAAPLLSSSAEVASSQVYLTPPDGRPALSVAFPIGEPARGYVAAEVSLAQLGPMLERERVGSSGFAYLADSRGRLVAGPGLGTLTVGAALNDRPAVAHLLATSAPSRGSESSYVGSFGEGEKRVVAAYSVLPTLGWVIVSEQPIELAYRQAATMERQIGLGVIGAVLVAGLLAAVLSQTLSKPLKRLGVAALEVARGAFHVRVHVSAKNELGDLAEAFNYMAAQVEAYSAETKRLYAGLENGYLETILALANSIDSKDAYTRGHSQRVGHFAVEIGRELGLTELELKQLRFGGILHDIGKIGIIDSILGKQSRLTSEEMVSMKDHPTIGDNIIKPISFLAPVRAAVRNHHERWDGTGYPDGLKGIDIPMIARIVCCADTFDACTSTRPYQQAVTKEQALDILEGLRGTQLDPAIVDALRRVIDKQRAGAAPGASAEPAAADLLEKAAS